MKILTKDWKRYSELNQLYQILDSRTTNVFPLFLEDYNVVSNSDLLKIDSETLDLLDIEKPLNYIVMQNSFYLCNSYSDSYRLEIKNVKDDIQSQIINRLRIISYLPKLIQDKIKDKRLFILGYTDNETKNLLKKYIKRFDIYVENRIREHDKMLRMDYNLKITEQLPKHNYDYVLDIFEWERLKKVYYTNNNLHLEMSKKAIILENAETLEEECNPNNTYIDEVEIYQTPSGFELHLLLDKLDSGLMDNYYYVTYAFKDMFFEEKDSCKIMSFEKEYSKYKKTRKL